MSDVYDRLTKLLANGFGLEPEELKPEDTFGHLEMDSLALVELTVAAEEEFGVTLTEAEVGPDSTLAQAARVIEAKAGAA
ncbi:phosphopantetheine-binding protein [Streptomyces sp. LP05-1]|uniref:Phosphopantetheine-binding protein n=1 Tax=Streptomyces pyxinae TaxID=2970734 RepID=A0ABT2CLS8_9ACTN|nr:phosphopantetheine-binding protein [Streptomyces sp. LP05-1]MCS0638362.1 phosphopantetheine-binding protein [Streptomyces sp. LP05-1]